MATLTITGARAGGNYCYAEGYTAASDSPATIILYATDSNGNEKWLFGSKTGSSNGETRWMFHSPGFDLEPNTEYTITPNDPSDLQITGFTTFTTTNGDIKLMNDSQLAYIGGILRTLEWRTNFSQPRLTAGTNITIDSNNVISATGGGEGHMVVDVSSIQSTSSNPTWTSTHTFQELTENLDKIIIHEARTVEDPITHTITTDHLYYRPIYTEHEAPNNNIGIYLYSAIDLPNTDSVSVKLLYLVNDNSLMIINDIIPIPTVTLQTTDPGEGKPLAANHFIGVYDA